MNRADSSSKLPIIVSARSIVLRPAYSLAFARKYALLLVLATSAGDSIVARHHYVPVVGAIPQAATEENREDGLSNFLSKLVDWLETLVWYGFVLFTYCMVVTVLIQTASKTDRLARWLALALGFSIHYISQRTGANLTELLSKTAGEIHTIRFLAIGAIVPSAAGAILCHLFLRKIHMSQVVGQRFIMLFGSFLISVMVDIFKDTYTSNTQPNFFFVTSFVIYYLLTARPGPPRPPKREQLND